MGKNTITRRLFTAFSRYRPRVFTLVVLAAIGGAIALVNLSEEYSRREVTNAPLTPTNLEFDLGQPTEDPGNPPYLTPGPYNMSHGCPLLWRQHVIGIGMWISVTGECYSVSRLSANVVGWLTMLAVPAGLCEWLLRRYWPRFRFSLRTMLVATGLAAALCGSFVLVRDRANVQDPLIDAIDERSGEVWLERWGEHWGPKWLDVFGADRYRRRIVGVRLNVSDADEEHEREAQRLLNELKRLPYLRYLSLQAIRLTPEMADALGELRGLETLQIDVSKLTADSGKILSGSLDRMPRLRALGFRASSSWTDRRALRNCLTVIGKQHQLEQLRLASLAIDSQELALLDALSNLKLLALQNLPVGPEQYLYPDPPLLSHLPALPRLEILDLTDSRVGDDDLPYLAALPRLKVLHLGATDVTGAGLALLGPLECLEELTIGAEAESPAGCEALLSLKRLSTLHLPISNVCLMLSPDELRAARGYFADWVMALAALRESKPGLAIDAEVNTFRWDEERMAPHAEFSLERSIGESAREAVKAWKEKQAGK